MASRKALMLGAKLTIEQHKPLPDADWPTGRCAQCPDDEQGPCPLLAEAKKFLAAALRTPSR